MSRQACTDCREAPQPTFRAVHVALAPADLPVET